MITRLDEDKNGLLIIKEKMAISKMSDENKIEVEKSAKELLDDLERTSPFIFYLIFFLVLLGTISFGIFVGAMFTRTESTIYLSGFEVLFTLALTSMSYLYKRQ